MSEKLHETLNYVLCAELDAAMSRIVHCLSQLTEEQIWHRPQPEMNAIGNLLLHLTGNLGQLIGSGVGGLPDHRDRPAEFNTLGGISSDTLTGKLILAVKNARVTILDATETTLCEPARIDRPGWTGLQAILTSVAHFRGHTQEIIHMTRVILGDQYQFAGPR